MDLRELQDEYRATVRAVSEDKLEIGCLIRTIISVDEGLAFKNGRTEKPKRLIIVGVDKNSKVCFGSVLVNTRMSPKADYTPEYLQAQYLMRKDNYPDFLDYDSYVDCGELFAIPLDKLLSGEYFGKLNEEDLNGIFEILETTETLTTKQKKRFGIRRR